jgi:hypothetical protein
MMTNLTHPPGVTTLPVAEHVHGVASDEEGIIQRAHRVAVQVAFKKAMA